MERAKKVLLVDDDPTASFLTERIFRKLEVEADLLTARNGREALEIIREACRVEQCPELILLDIHMPVMDGFEFLEELQKDPGLNTNPLRIVLLSSSRHHLDQAKAKRYPVIDCLEKPLTAEALTRCL